MSEITPELFHEWKVQHSQPKHKPPFLGGLRTGYVRAWVFVVVKVILLTAYFNGFNPVVMVEQNVALLDSYIHNDYHIHPVPLVYTKHKNKTVTLRPRMPEQAQSNFGTVAGDSTAVPQLR